MSHGYIKISRKLFEHEFWLERRQFSYAEAWLDLLQSARYKEGTGKQLIKGRLFSVKRGQILRSNRLLLRIWGWKSLSRVQNFLKLLQDEGMITVENLGKTSRITICKYESYNSSEVSKESVKSHSKVSQESVNGQSEVSQESLKGQLRKKERKKEGNKGKKEKTTTSLNAAVEDLNEMTFENYAAQIRDDELFLEMICRKQKIKTDLIFEMLKNFMEYKRSLGELNHKSYNDFRKNFMYWIPKQDFEKFGKETNGKKKTGQFPNEWNERFFKKLSGPEITDYFRHLRSLGLKASKAPNGKILDWVFAEIKENV